MAGAAVLALARVELRRSWRTLVVLGLLAGLTAGAALAGVATARRTASAHDRLLAATALDDARVLLFGRPEAGPEVADLPGVAASWTASATVGQVRGGDLQYVAVTSGPPKPPDLFTPVVVQGRDPAPDAAHEVVVTEQLAQLLDLAPGSSLPLTLLEPEEVYAFDTGFGEPDGPPVDLRVTGVVRVASAGNEGTGPVYAGPAFAERFRDSAAGLTQLVRLEPGADARRRFEAALAQLSRSPAQAAASREFGPLRALYPAQRTDPQVATAERVLGTALRLVALLAAAAGALATVQGFSRLAAAGAQAQRTESALGLVTAERVAARVLPAVPAAVLAALLAAGGALAAGRVEPLGRLARFEPSPGWAPDLSVALGGAALTALAVLATAAATARSAGRVRGVRGTPAPRALPALLRGPVLVVGTRFALSRSGSGATAVPVRTTLVGVVVATCGVVATATFAASLSAVRDAPASYGWSADFAVVNAEAGTLARLAADPDVRDVDLVHETTVQVAGRVARAYAAQRRTGALPWTVVEGRLPRAPGEAALGPQLAERLGVVPGDVLPVGASGTATTVVGVVQAPALGGERLGSSVLLPVDDLTTAAESQPLLTALVRTRGDAGPVHARYAADLELVRATAPPEVDNLADLGRLPGLLQAYLAAVGALALGHALVLTCRRRARDVGVLRALGLSSRQVAATLCTMAGVTTLVGLLVGVPLGLAVGRLAWGEAAAALGLASGAQPPVTVLALVPAALVLALVVAALPAQRAARLSPAAVLQAE